MGSTASDVIGLSALTQLFLACFYKSSSPILLLSHKYNPFMSFLNFIPYILPSCSYKLSTTSSLPILSPLTNSTLKLPSSIRASVTYLPLSYAEIRSCTRPLILLDWLDDFLGASYSNLKEWIRE